MTVPEKINALRKAMKAHGIYAYIVCTEDFHGSEYVGAHFMLREFLSGFTGSAGTLVVTETEAALWTDGRYFIQAAEQLCGSGIALMKSGAEGVPTIYKYLAEKMPEGSVLGFDGRTVRANMARALERELSAKKVTLSAECDLGGEVWTDRPPLSAGPVYVLPEKYAGVSRSEKLKNIREKMAAAGADHYAVTALDEIAWTLNLRGNDVEYNPVFLAYMMIGADKAELYANAAIFGGEIISQLSADGVELRPYEDFYSELSGLDGAVMYDPSEVNYLFVKSLPEGVKRTENRSPIMLMKAVKNPAEITAERAAHIKDGAAVTRFMYWLKNNVGRERITEISAAEKLEEFRRAGEGYLGQSFAPIMAYGAHAAVVHYSATEESSAELRAEGMLLSDTGGHYCDGTTDITRTYVLGKLTDEEKRGFTLVLAGHLNLAAAKFMYGCKGANLDYTAREPLWRYGMDFNHGTGHGVGYLLNVHEGPNRIAWRIRPTAADCVLEEGMITSDEPGLYVEGKFGIRHESLLLCRESERTEFGRFMEFETLTMVPFDPDGVDVSYFSDRELERFNAYQKMVCDNIAPLLPFEEAEWLGKITRPLVK